jgi:hypothetical protein
MRLCVRTSAQHCDRVSRSQARVRFFRWIFDLFDHEPVNKSSNTVTVCLVHDVIIYNIFCSINTHHKEPHGSLLTGLQR